MQELRIKKIPQVHNVVFCNSLDAKPALAENIRYPVRTSQPRMLAFTASLHFLNRMLSRSTRMIASFLYLPKCSTLFRFHASSSSTIFCPSTPRTSELLPQGWRYCTCSNTLASRHCSRYGLVGPVQQLHSSQQLEHCYSSPSMA